MDFPSPLFRFTALASVLVLASGVACQGGGSGSRRPAPAPIRSRRGTRGRRPGAPPVPTNTILADTAACSRPRGWRAERRRRRRGARALPHLGAAGARGNSAGAVARVLEQRRQRAGGRRVGRSPACRASPAARACARTAPSRRGPLGLLGQPSAWTARSSSGTATTTLPEVPRRWLAHRPPQLGGTVAMAARRPTTGCSRPRSGRILTFGLTADSHVTVSDDLPAPQNMTWALSRVEDRAGNFMTVTYKTRPAATSCRADRLHRIDIQRDDAALGHVRLRQIATSRRSAEHRGRATLHFSERLAALAMHAPNSAGMATLRSFTLAYAPSPTTGRSILSSVAECDGPAARVDSRDRLDAALPAGVLHVRAGHAAHREQRLRDRRPGLDRAAIADALPTPVEGQSIRRSYSSTSTPTGATTCSTSRTTAASTTSCASPRAPHSARRSTPASPSSMTKNLPGPVYGTSAPIVLDFDGDGHDDVLVNQGPVPGAGRDALSREQRAGSWQLGGGAYQLTLSRRTGPTKPRISTATRCPISLMMQGSTAYYSDEPRRYFADLSARPSSPPSRWPLTRRS